MLNKNFKYIKFIISKLRDELYLNGFELSNSEADKLITFLEKSDDLLRDIFVLSGFKKYVPISSYLIFIYKKVEEREISYGTLPVNINKDIEFLKKIFISSLKIQNPETSINTNLDEVLTVNNENTEITSLKETDSNFEEWEVSEEITPGMFAVGDIEKDIVTEEFSEDEIQQLYTPIEREEEEDDFVSSGLQQDQENIYDEKNENESIEEVKEFNTETKKDEVADDTELTEILESENTLIENDITESNYNYIEEESDENEETLFSEKDLNEEEIKTEELTGSYLTFLNDVSDRHNELKEEFAEILNNTENDNRTQRNEITLSIIKKTSELKDISDNKNFEIISNIYSFILNYFKNTISIPFLPATDDLNTFSESLDGIMNFLNEEDIGMIEKVLNQYEKISLKIERERVRATDEAERRTIAIEEEKKSQKKESEKIKTEPITDGELELIPVDERRYMTKLLKVEITNLETVFNSIYEIKTDFPVYEAQRQLSKTFNILKRILGISRRINVPKLGRLCEATYSFIKFIQSYRLDLFTETIRQIFNYIIYNFKLITLDKPTKDYEEFVKHLNNPITIFNKKEK